MSRFTQTELLRLALEARGEKHVPERSTANYDAYTRTRMRTSEGELVQHPTAKPGGQPTFYFVSRVGFGLRTGTMASKSVGTTLVFKRRLVDEGREAVGGSK